MDLLKPGYEYRNVHGFVQGLLAAIPAIMSVVGTGLSVSDAVSGDPEVQAGPMEKATAETYLSHYLPAETDLFRQLGFTPGYNPVSKRFEMGRGKFNWKTMAWEEAGSKYLPETVRQTAEVGEGYGRAAAGARRLGGVTSPAGGGLASGVMANLPLMQARDTAKVRATDPERRWNKTFAVSELGRGMRSSAMDAESRRSGLSTALQSQYATGLSSAISSVGDTFSNLAQYYQNRNKTPASVQAPTYQFNTPSMPTIGGTGRIPLF